jgi:hypothetical protein
LLPPRSQNATRKWRMASKASSSVSISGRYPPRMTGDAAGLLAWTTRRSAS